MGVYIITAPVYPAIFKPHSAPNSNVPSSRAISISEGSGIVLQIPSIGVIEKIPPNKRFLDMVWKIKYSANPGEGNTVIVGHRFSYIDPVAPPFYDLDKVKIGDEVILKYKTQVFKYKVVRIYVTMPNDFAVERETEEVKLTLYTCTPLLNPIKRLIIESKLVSIQ